MKRIFFCWFYFWGICFPEFSPAQALLRDSLHIDSLSVRGRPGYFRVGKTVNGQWWFLTPENKPFFYKGVCAVNRAGTAGGRNAKPGRYAVTIDRKYDYQSSPDSFVQACLAKIKSVGFNALGAWTTEEFFNRGVPFTEILEFFKEPPFLAVRPGQEELPDIFDTVWQISADRKARGLCSALRNSKDLVGYFTDNEIGFGGTDDSGFDPGFKGGQFDGALLRNVLASDTGTAASRYAGSFLLSRYNGSFEKLSKAWEVVLASKEDIHRMCKSNITISGHSYEDDEAAFSFEYASRYFELAYRMIRRYDPNHLILGCRFGSPPPQYVLDASRPWTDVISANNYRPTLYERYDTVYQHTGLPLLIGEFSWNTDLFKKVPLPGEAAQALSMKERMFASGSAALTRLAIHPGMVGFTWYRWVQGTSTDSIFYDGIVNVNDELDMHVSELKRLLPDLERRRARAEDGDWKESPVYSGQMVLFFDGAWPGKNQALHAAFRSARPVEDVYGWRMKGKMLSFSLRRNLAHLKIRIGYGGLAGRQTEAGIFEMRMIRQKEKFFGNYTGMWNGAVIHGKVNAFYFP